MSKQKTPPVPSTVLVITLNADGSGSLLARRGDLAHLSQFSYSGLGEIVSAIQRSALALIEVEQNPPVIPEPPSPPLISVQPIVAENVPSEDLTTDESNEIATANNASSDTQNTLF